MSEITQSASNKNNRARAWITDVLALLVGSSLFGAGFHMFLLPDAIVLGGATGIATVLNVMFGWRAGIVSACVNLPLLAISLVVYGKKGIARALAGILAASVAVEAFSFLPPLTDETLIAAVFGGGVMAVGLGIAFLRGFTSGGSDLAAFLLRSRVRGVSLGTMVFLIDAAIIVAAAVALRSFSGLFYSIVAIVVYSYVLDLVISRAQQARLALMICPEEQARELTQAIADRVGRGITCMHAAGWYTGKEKQVLLCAVKPREAGALADLVKEMSPSTFLVFLSAPQIFGNRFSENTMGPIV